MKRENCKAMLGKTITGLVAKESTDGSPPGCQIFLLFSDGTHGEFYSDAKIAVAQLWEGGRDEVRAYMAPSQRTVLEVFV